MHSKLRLLFVSHEGDTKGNAKKGNGKEVMIELVRQSTAAYEFHNDDDMPNRIIRF